MLIGLPAQMQLLYDLVTNIGSKEASSNSQYGWETGHDFALTMTFKTVWYRLRESHLPTSSRYLEEIVVVIVCFPSSLHLPAHFAAGQKTQSKEKATHR